MNYFSECLARSNGPKPDGKDNGAGDTRENNGIKINEENVNKEKKLSPKSILLFKRTVHIYCHNDTDGLTGGAIFTRALIRKRIGFQMSFLKQLDKGILGDIKKEVKETGHFILFIDLGSNHFEEIREYLDDGDFMILDHHTPNLKSFKNALDDFISQPPPNHLNPYCFGINGSREISAAGLCYFFVVKMDEKNKHLSYLAIIGALSDGQNIGNKGTFLGLNERIVKDALENDVIKTERNLSISRLKPITQALAHSLKIEIPGLTENEKAVEQFLEEHNIHPYTELNEPRRLIDLSEREKKTLSSAITKYASKKGADVKRIAKSLVTTYYLIPMLEWNNEILDAQEVSLLINATIRMGFPSIVIAALLGDKKAFDRMIKLKEAYTKIIGKAVKWAINHIKEKPRYYLLNGENEIDDMKIGPVMTVLNFSGKFSEKPIIGYTRTGDGRYEISVRCGPDLWDKGMHMGYLLYEATKKLDIGTLGGGHPMSAGVILPENKLDKFLKIIDELLILNSNL